MDTNGPDEFLYAFGVIEELNALWLHVNPAGLNISTMTVIAQAARPTRVSLAALAAVGEPHMEWLLGVGRSHPACPRARLRLVVEKKRRHKPGQFGNQVTLAYESLSCRSIKVFSNGELHLTGCKGLGEYERLAQVVAGLLFAVGAVEQRLLTRAPTVRMLNCNFSIGCELSLACLWHLFAGLGEALSFETETHPALKISLSYATPMIFKSGHVQISSKAGLAGLLAAYRLVCQVVDENFGGVQAKVSVEPKRTGARRRVQDVVDGYPMGQILPCLPARPKTPLLR